MSWTVTTKDDTGLAEIAGQVRHRAGLVRVLVREGVNRFQRHFRRRAGVPNKLGGTRTHYWASAAEATHGEALNDAQGRVSVNHPGLRLHFFGGDVRPVTRKYLTIPAVAEAHGRRATEFPDLFVLRNRAGFPVALARIDHARGGEDGVLPVFWLKKRVKHRPDPSVLPERDSLFAALRQRAGRYLAREQRTSAA